MELEYEYESAEQIPEKFRDLYEETDGVFRFAAIKDVKSQGDVDRLSRALDAERREHRATKKKLEPWRDLDPAKVRADLDRIPELEAAAELDPKDEERVNKLLEARVAQTKAPLERELARLREENSTLASTVDGLRGDISRRDLLGHVRRAAETAKILPSAMADLELLAPSLLELTEDGTVVTREVFGQTAGLDLKSFFEDARRSRPHWWPQSQGGGAGGSGARDGGRNPWKKDTWNVTEQMRLAKSDPARAAALREAAGAA